jgi:hypothetical protein
MKTAGIVSRTMLFWLPRKSRFVFSSQFFFRQERCQGVFAILSRPIEQRPGSARCLDQMAVLAIRRPVAPLSRRIEDYENHSALLQALYAVPLQIGVPMKSPWILQDGPVVPEHHQTGGFSFFLGTSRAPTQVEKLT